MTHLSPSRFCLLMRRHGWTIRDLAISGGVNHDRIRELRREGIYVGKGTGSGHADTVRIASLNVWGWLQILRREAGEECGMSDKPTPGPWHVKKAQFVGWEYVIVPDDDYAIAGVIGMADARLIAAAPTMLEALKAAWEIRMIDPDKFRAAHPQMSADEMRVLEGTEKIAAAIKLAGLIYVDADDLEPKPEEE